MKPTLELSRPAVARRPAAQRLWPSAARFGLAAALVWPLPAARAEHRVIDRAHQSGNLSDSHTASLRDIPPHAPGYLGILFGNVSEEEVSALHLKSGHGVEIVMVDHDGPAGKVGLRPHDVIVSMNGQPVVSADALRGMIHDAGVGTMVSLGVLRAGRQITVTTALAYRGEVEREAAERMAVPVPPDASEEVAGGGGGDPAGSEEAGRGPGFLSQMLHSTPFTGLMVEAMEPQLAGFFGAAAGQGLLVETVLQGSPAERSGLRAGDVIERVDSVGVRSTSEWVRRLHAAKGRPLVLTVLRDRRERTMTLTPELKHRSKVDWPTEWPMLLDEESSFA